MIYRYLLIIPFMVFVGCSGVQNKNKNLVESVTVNSVSEAEIDTFKLLTNRCLICHGAGSSHDNMLAPPLRGVKNHYLDVYDTKEKFVEAIVIWTENPDSNIAIMNGAISHFGIMPKLNYPTEEVTAIANYIYETEQAKPLWMKK